MPIRIPRNRIDPSSPPSTGAPILGRQIAPVSGAPVAESLKFAGQELKSLGGLALQVAQREQRKLDVTDATTASLEFRTVISDSENQLFSLKEGATRGGAEKSREDIDTAFNKIADGIESAEAQRLFRATAGQDIISSNSRTTTYERRETDKHFINSTNASVDQAVGGAVANPYDEMYQVIAGGEVTKASESLGEFFGWTDEQKKEFEDKHFSEMFKGIIENQLTINARDAKDTYEDIKDEINPRDRPAIEEKLKRYGVLQESQVQADSIHSRANQDNLSLTEELDLIPKDDPEVRKATEDLIRQKARDDDYADIQARESEKSEFLKVLNENDADVKAMTDSANSISHQADRNNALQMIRTQQKQAISAIKQQVEKDSPKQLYQAITDIDKKLITNEDQLFNKYFNKLSSGDFQKAQGHFRQGGSVGGIPGNTVSAVFRRFFGNPEKKKDAFVGAWKYIREQVESGGPGFQATPERIEKWMADVSQTGEETEGFIWDNMSYAVALGKGLEDVWLPFVEDKEEGSIIGAMKAYNLTPGVRRIKVNDRSMREWKRTQIMGLPPSKRSN